MVVQTLPVFVYYYVREQAFTILSITDPNAPTDSEFPLDGNSPYIQELFTLLGCDILQVTLQVTYLTPQLEQVLVNTWVTMSVSILEQVHVLVYPLILVKEIKTNLVLENLLTQVTFQRFCCTSTYTVFT